MSASGASLLPAAAPGPLTEFANRMIGPFIDLTEASWERQAVPRFSRVWRITDRAGTTSYIKQHPTRDRHDREVSAYREWTIVFGAQAPTLIGADATILVIAMSCLPGEPVSTLRLDVRDESAVHHQAGRLLRKLHDAQPPGKATSVNPRTGAKARHALRCCDRLVDVQRMTRVRELIEAVETIDLAVSPTHGDYQHRNWLWVAPTRRLALIDFERAQRDWAVRDFAKLECGSWSGRPDLKAAFFAGYGRRLTEAESFALAGLSAVQAVHDLLWALQNGEATDFDRTLGILARLAASSAPTHNVN